MPRVSHEHLSRGILRGTYLQIRQEAHIVHEGHRVEHIEFGVVRDDERVADELVQSLLQAAALLRALFKRRLGAVVEEVRRVQQIVLGVLDDRRRQRVEREVVCDLVRLGVLRWCAQSL